jgi:V/A-type H+/Na+-transporting ATPase subunit C
LRLLAPRADFTYGNTRLRARRASLLVRSDYEAMLGGDVDAILGALSSTPYHPDVEAAITRYRGARRVHEAARQHLARKLEEMRSFYDGGARELVDLLLSRWDTHNVLTLMRGVLTAPGTEEALAYVLPMGALNDALAREVARQNELATAVQLLVRWRLPDHETARALRRAWSEYERTEDFPALEHAVTARWIHRTVDALEAAGREGEPLRRFFDREIAERNLLIALRLREALARGEIDRLPSPGDVEVYLPSSTARLDRFDEAIRLPDAEGVATALADIGASASWHEPLERWTREGSLLALQHELEARRLRDAVALFFQGDPLGVDVPIAYAVAKDAEARNLRLVAEAAVHNLSEERVRERMLFFGLGEEPA